MPRKSSENSVSGEHIFPNTRLTALAFRWKELQEQGRTVEAMPILEEIIIGSTKMFERFAQHEHYHLIVDLPVLVSAAQEKVPRWLMKWDPKYGKKLFSFFNTSLSYDSLVSLSDGTFKQIGEIVENKLEVEVKSWDFKENKVVHRKVTDWIKTPTSKELKPIFQKLSTFRPHGRGRSAGRGRSLFITADHPVQTARGWVEVKDLRSTDKVMQLVPYVTDTGRKALVGMYLGDGHLTSKGLFVVSHGQPQEAYNQHIADKFGKKLSYGEHDTYGKTHKHNQVCVPLKSLWPTVNECFPKKKGIVPWLLSEIDEVSLAYWYMDDGYASGRGVFSSQSFTKEECQLLQGILKDRFLLESEWVQNPGKKYGAIRILPESRDKLYTLIAPYFIPEMQFKLPEEYRGRYEPLGDFTSFTVEPVPFKVRDVVGHANTRIDRGGVPYYNVDFSVRYDIEVEGTYNFFAESILVHNCAKHAFLSEVLKAQQHNLRFFVPGDNALEILSGAEDHAIDKQDLAEDLKRKIRESVVRWGDPQEIGAMRFFVEAITSDDHDKAKAIKGCCYAWGVSPEMSKFFYRSCLIMLRDIMYEKAYVPFTEQDLFRHEHSYTQLVDLLDIISWEQMKKVIAVMGGTRLKIPTLTQMSKLKDNYDIFQEIEKTDLDPAAIKDIAKKRRKSAKSAAELFDEMCATLNPQRSGEYNLYE